MNKFDLTELKKEIKQSGYDFKIENTEKYFLSEKSKCMDINNNMIGIYIYKDNESMEKDAKNFDSSACLYCNGEIATNFNWGGEVHFYKKGNIILNYVGEDINIINTLTKIMGKQFAGMQKEIMK